MNRRDLSHLHVLHVTIEAVTPISVGSGRHHGFEDAPIVLDHAGLPAIPGTSIAGVLRSLYAPEDGAIAADQLFGFAGRKAQGSPQSFASLLEVSNAFVHGNDNQPAVSPQIDQKGDLSDPFLRLLRKSYLDQPPMRKRVKLHEGGAADDSAGGLFDKTFVPRGTRFTFELAVFMDKDASASGATLRSIKSLLEHAEFRLGGSTRAGMGAVRVVALGEWSFDLANAAGYDRYRKMFQQLQTFRADRKRLKLAARLDKRLKLTALDYWRIGNSPKALDGVDHEEANLAPFVEDVVTWSDRGAKLETRLLVPASAVKGALRHRTAFHYNRLSGTLVDADDPLAVRPSTDANAAVKDIFGYVKGNERGASGARGRLILNDAYVEIPKSGEMLTIVHNAIDRFTGGVRDGFLFGEQMIWKMGFEFGWTLLPGQGEVSRAADRALEMAIDDLAEGRLALGAASGRGHGYFNAERVQEKADV